MATTGAVLGVIRASHPILRTAIERVAFAVHAAFLATGYTIIAVGAAANAGAYAEGTEEPEVGSEGWNTLEGAYAFCYSGVGQPYLCNSVTLKLVVMADSLMVDVAPSETEILHHLEIRANDFAKDGEEAGNYAQQFINLDGLIKQINNNLLVKLSPPRIMASANLTLSSSTSLVRQNERLSDTRRASTPPLIYNNQHSIGNPNFVVPPISIDNNSGLYLRSNGGIFVPRRDLVCDGMLIGPDDVQWQLLNGDLQLQLHDFDELSVPPNARYDPIGPPSISYIDSIHYNRSTNRIPETHPDLEHF